MSFSNFVFMWSLILFYIFLSSLLYERAKIANYAGEEVLMNYHLYYIFNVIKNKKSVTT